MAKAANFSISSLEYKYPVGFPGLQIKIALVFGVISFSKVSIDGNAKRFSKVVGIGFTMIFPVLENPM